MNRIISVGSEYMKPLYCVQTNHLSSFKNNVTHKLFTYYSYIAQSDGAVEYTDCISAAGYDPHQ